VANVNRLGKYVVAQSAVVAQLRGEINTEAQGLQGTAAIQGFGQIIQQCPDSLPTTGIFPAPTAQVQGLCDEILNGLQGFDDPEGLGRSIAVAQMANGNYPVTVSGPQAQAAPVIAQIQQALGNRPNVAFRADPVPNLSLRPPLTGAGAIPPGTQLRSSENLLPGSASRQSGGFYHRDLVEWRGRQQAEQLPRPK
jgi:hypothetical protein